VIDDGDEDLWAWANQLLERRRLEEGDCPVPKTSEMIPSKYLRKEDIDGDKLVTIKTIEKVNVAREDSAPEYRWAMMFQEFAKPLILNSTNIQICEAVFGSDDSDNWLGKKVVLYVDPTIQLKGKIVGGLRLRAPRARAAAPAAAAQVNEAKGPPPGHPAAADFDDDIPF